MAFLQRKQIGIESTGTKVSIPENDVAKLMYYFNCVCYVIEYDDTDMQRYRDFNNWYLLSAREVRLLVALCYTLSPDVFDNKAFFRSDAMSASDVNKFYKINEVSHQVIAASSIVIAGRTRKVNRIMMYKMSWMHQYYFGPMRRLA
ncbi:hypothetical protein I4U23_024179 [Adineta vaga]|nr:hypothetical protein I4U23_024179 [Adineta vaga]